MKKRILFIRWGSFSSINDNIHKILQNEFPEHQIDVIDVGQVVKKNIKYSHYLKNLWYFLNEYGKDFAKGDKKLSKENLYVFYTATSYIVPVINKFITDAVNAGDYLFTFQTQSIFNAKLKGVPHFIYTDHTTLANLLYPDINPKEYIRSEAFIKKVEQRIYDDANITFTCGSLITYSLINQYHIAEQKALTVLAGSNVPDQFVPNDAKYASKNILFVGVDWERKGGPVLIKVFEKVLQKHKDASLTIVGCSPQNITLPNCNIIGRISVTELAKYYNNAAVFCLPTLREPFGIVFVEAMHYKLPIVANNIGSIPDMVINDYNGYLINNNVDAYADQICKLLENPQQCKQLGENGYAHAQSKFRWDLVGKRMKEQMIPYL